MSTRGNRWVIMAALVLAFLGVMAAFLVAKSRLSLPPHPAHYPKELGRAFPCPGKTEETVNSDSFLPGVLKEGEPIRLTWNWYVCHPAKVGEIAMLRISRDLPPHPRVVRAVEGDSLKIRKLSPSDRWTLFVNGKQVLDFEGKPYLFGGKDLPLLGRYIEAHRGKVAVGDVVALSTRAPGDSDSGIFGTMGADDLVAKVEKVHP